MRGDLENGSVRSDPENDWVRRVTLRPSRHLRLRWHRAPKSPQRHPWGRIALRRRVTDADHRATAFHRRAHASRCERDPHPHRSGGVRLAKRCAESCCSSQLFPSSCGPWRHRAAGIPAGIRPTGIGADCRERARDRLAPAPSTRSVQLGRHGLRRCRPVNPQSVVPVSIPGATAPGPARVAREGEERTEWLWSGIVRRWACRDTTDDAGRFPRAHTLPCGVGREAQLGRTRTSRARRRLQAFVPTAAVHR
jgi:hypothetical protein